MNLIERLKSGEYDYSAKEVIDALEAQQQHIESLQNKWASRDLSLEAKDAEIARLQRVADQALAVWRRLHHTEDLDDLDQALTDLEPIRDASCLDAGCDIDGKHPHKPHCDHADLEEE